MPLLVYKAAFYRTSIGQKTAVSSAVVHHSKLSAVYINYHSWWYGKVAIRKQTISNLVRRLRLLQFWNADCGNQYVASISIILYRHSIAILSDKQKREARRLLQTIYYALDGNGMFDALSNCVYFLEANKYRDVALAFICYKHSGLLLVRTLYSYIITKNNQRPLVRWKIVLQSSLSLSSLKVASDALKSLRSHLSV